MSDDKKTESTETAPTPTKLGMRFGDSRFPDAKPELPLGDARNEDKP